MPSHPTPITHLACPGLPLRDSPFQARALHCLRAPSVQGLAPSFSFSPLYPKPPTNGKVFRPYLSVRAEKKFVKLEPQNTYILQLHLI